MKAGLPISLLGHAAVVGAAFIAFDSQPMPIEDVPIIPVEILEISDERDIRAAIKAPEPKPAPEPEAPSVDTASLDDAEEEAPTPVEEVVEPEPTPPKPEPEPVPDPEPEPEPEPGPEEPGPTFDLDALSDLVNRERSAQQEANRTRTAEADVANIDQALEAREGFGEQVELSRLELDELRRRMMACWRVPADAPDPESLVVHVGLDITRDGIPYYISIVAPSSRQTKDPYMKVAQERALRAVEKCAPYDFLPQDKYKAWQTIEMTFSPTQSHIEGYIEP